jgi:hypothetical protein
LIRSLVDEILATRQQQTRVAGMPDVMMKVIRRAPYANPMAGEGPLRDARGTRKW